MLMHQGIGLDRFNQLPRSKAMHALFECCCSVVWSTMVVDARPYESHDALFTRADRELFELSEADIDDALQCHPDIGARVASEKSALEQCAVPLVNEKILDRAVEAGGIYRERFGFRYLACVSGRTADELLMDMEHRLDNPAETERKIVRNELAKINRIRIGRMLGPEGGYPEF